MQPAPISELVAYIVKSLVDHPDQVVVQQIDDGNAITIEVEVAETDTGRVIGREGRVINAIRTLVHASGAAAGQTITLEVI